MFKRLLQIAIPTAEPRSAHAARNAMIGSGVIDADDVFAGLGHSAVSFLGCGFAASVFGVGL